MILPYKNRKDGKKEQIAFMFDKIAHRYDFLNHFLSAGTDRRWRKKAIRLLKNTSPEIVLDIATGTADMAIQTCLDMEDVQVTGIDISEKMLEIGKSKIHKQMLDSRIKLLKADSENLPFDNDTFDASTVAFGIRNFENLRKGLREIYRVLKPGSIFVILEFSNPRNFPFKQFYGFYFNRILPLIANLFSKDNEAYKYLPASVNAFPEREELIRILKEEGFSRCTYKQLTFGIASIYVATKKE